MTPANVRCHEKNRNIKYWIDLADDFPFPLETHVWSLVLLIKRIELMQREKEF